LGIKIFLGDHPL